MTAKQEQALAALMSTSNRKEAAKAAGITDRTLRGYFKDQEFRAEYRARCFEIADEAALRAKHLLNQAMSVFEKVMNDPEERNAVKLQAADRAAEYAMKLTAQSDIIAEITELREAIAPDEID